MLLLLCLTITSDKYLALARLVLLARKRSMTRLCIGMTADLLGFAAWLLALCTTGVLTVSRSVALLSTEVRSATKLFAANLSTADILQPALLVLQCLLATHALLLDQIWAFRARHIVLMTCMRHLRMTTSLQPLALIATRRRLSATGQWWLQNSPSAMATDLVKDSFSA